jgi:flagellar motility protein MotE (MotC chaperone)
MILDYETVTTLRKSHPAWRLLMADHTPLIASFLYRTFIAPNQRTLSRSELASALDDYLYALRATEGEGTFPRSAEAYLDDWATDEKGWLRKFYPQGSDEIHYDLTPSVEKAIGWLEGLVKRSFIGTESRLMTVFELLRQMVEGAEADQAVRIQELEKRKAAIENELDRVRAGHLDFLDDTALKDRFLQLNKTARELLSDFREVEYNFRVLDQKVREQIALWEGSKGKLLEDFFGERDVIAESDQGKSFNAFWGLLMSPAKQEELSRFLNRVFEMKAVIDLSPDTRLKRIHYDWLEAGEHTQRTVAKLSGQLRRYLDDQVFLENKRIMQVIQSIETHAIHVRNQMPDRSFMEIDQAAPEVVLPMERPLYKQPVKPVIDEAVELGDGSDIPKEILREQTFVEKARLKAHIRRYLQERDQAFLTDIIAEHPLEKGLAELVAYLVIAADDDKALFDDTVIHTVSFTDRNGVARKASFPAVIFSR